jgi:hypothetical protein
LPVITAHLQVTPCRPAAPRPPAPERAGPLDGVSLLTARRDRHVIPQITVPGAHRHRVPCRAGHPGTGQARRCSGARAVEIKHPGGRLGHTGRRGAGARGHQPSSRAVTLHLPAGLRPGGLGRLRAPAIE